MENVLDMDGKVVAQNENVLMPQNCNLKMVKKGKFLIMYISQFFQKIKVHKHGGKHSH